MRIAIVGAGALGSIYALRLSRVAPVTLVVRDLDRAPRRIVGEKVNGSSPAEDALAAPSASTTIPGDADAVLVTVRVEQLTDALLEKLAHAGPEGRIVVTLTPLLPQDHDRVRAALGERLVVGMPGVVAYEPESHENKGERRIRYWTPRATPTALDARPASDPRAATMAALCETMVAAGLPCVTLADVRTINPATTIAFFPMLLGIEAAGGSIAKLIDDTPLMRLSLDASKEARALSKTVGELASFSSLFFSFASPFTVRAGAKLARLRYPESITFLERHFGSKLHTQHAAMLAMITALARERHVPVDNLLRLSERASAGRRHC